MNSKDYGDSEKGAGRKTSFFMEPSQIPRPHISREVYEKIAGSAQLRYVSMVTSRSFVHPEYFLVSCGDAQDLKYIFEGMPLEVHFDKEESDARGMFHWRALASIPGPDSTGGEGDSGSENHLVSIEATYVIYYKCIDSFDDDAVRDFIKTIGRMTTYPFFRAHVSRIAWDSGVDMPILPMIRP